MAARHAAAPDQLPLALATPVSHSGLPPRLRAMVPAMGPGPFDDDAWFFEPWWPGRPAVAVVEGGAWRLCLDQLGDPTGAFPELRSLPDQVRSDGVAIAGTLLVLDAAGRPDLDLLRLRLAGTAPRHGTGAFVASDLLWDDGRSLASWPFAQRRARLLAMLTDGDHAMASRGLRGEGRTLATAIASMGLDAISARRLSARALAGPDPDAYLRLPVLTPTAPEARPLLVLLRRLPLDEDE